MTGRDAEERPSPEGRSFHASPFTDRLDTDVSNDSSASASANGPYAPAAPAWLAAGWPPLPMPYACKEEPPSRFTGYEGKDANAVHVESWVRGHGDGNVVVRLP